MDDKTWKYCSSSDDEYVPSLHDAYAEKLELEGDELRLFFPDGFKLIPGDPLNPYDDPRQTGPSKVVFSLRLFPDGKFGYDDVIFLEFFHDHWLRPIRLFRKDGPFFITCSRPKVEKLAEKLNSGAWRLEFVSKFTHYDIGYLYECYIHTKRRVYRCYLTVDCRKVRFCWNEVSEEPAW